MTRSLLMVLLLLATASAAHAHKATEIYIPIGRSPGLSGKVTVTGFIATVDDHTMVMSVKGADGGWRAVVTDRSKIYIDRSAQRRPNRYGTMDDCKPGHFCEIKYVSGDAAALRRRGEPREIEWIKIRPDNRRSQAEPADHRVARRSGSSTASPPRVRILSKTARGRAGRARHAGSGVKLPLAPRAPYGATSA